VIDLLRQYTPAYLDYYGGQAVPQVQSVLAKLALCRTAALGGHVYECPQCQHRLPLYNSCRDRHCPLCSGGRRADWLAKTAELLLPQIDYFQAVFTLPEELWGVMLGNRRTTYRLLFHAAWQALNEVLREELGCVPAALLVLHTWNQRLDHYPHLHALIPGGGPSLDGQRWVRSRHRRHHRRRRPYLVDNRLLSERFRDKFLAGLQRLHRDHKLKLHGAWSKLQTPAAFAVWLKTFRDSAWVVYVEPPPTEEAQPEYVLKYLARYLTGGPLSDRRLIDHHAGQVTFWARSGDKRSGNKSEPYPLPGAEFTRRWALHILPKGLVKSRSFGGFSCRQRADYLARCRALLGGERAESTAAPTPPEEPPPPRLCPRCQTPLECVSEVQRPGWNRVLNGPDRPAWYDPFGHALTWDGLRWYREPAD
jgi:hypothetical protein